MDAKAFFLTHWEKEAPATRKVISRIPENAEYRPDPKARTAREIAWLIVFEESAVADGLERGVFEWKDVPAPKTMKEIVAQYDRAHDAISKRLQSIPPACWEEKLPFLYNGQEMMRETGYEMAWGSRPDSPSWSAVNLSASDGRKGSGHLRP